MRRLCSSISGFKETYAPQRRKLPQLEVALTGQFTEHHARILQLSWELIALHNQQMAALDQQIGELVAPLAPQMEQLTSLLDAQQAFSSIPWGDVFVRVQDFVTQAGEVGPVVEAKALALVHQHLLQQATVSAYQDCFVLLTTMALVVMPLVFFLRQRQAD